MKFLEFFKRAGYAAVVLTMQFTFASFGQEPTVRFDTVQILERARRLSDEAHNLEPAAEISLQARLADIVWDCDQSLAERLLARSFELTIALLKDSPQMDSGSSDAEMLFAHVSSIAAKHNQKLEKKLRERWQETVATVTEKSKELKSDPARIAYLLLRESASSLKSDKQKARQLFRESVSLRVTQDHVF